MRVHLIRHGQAEHNVTHDNSIRDPLLTERGHEQAVDVLKRYPWLARLNNPWILASPLRRTLQTTLDAFGDTLLKVFGLTAHPALQEAGGEPANTGLSRQELEKQFPGLDFSLLTPDWNSNQGFYGPTEEDLQIRARYMLNYIFEQGESKGIQDAILVVHHGTIRALTGLPLNLRWGNGECRSYEYRRAPNGSLHLSPVVVE